MGAKANGKEKHNQNASLSLQKAQDSEKNLGGWLVYDVGLILDM